MKNGLLIVILFSFGFVYAQTFPTDALKKKLKADRIDMDLGNEDGVFKARNAKTHKWGMYQWMYEGTNLKELIPMAFDSLRNIPFNGNFSIVYLNGKLGVYLAEWSYGDDARQTVPCKYEDYKRYNADGRKYLAVKRDGKWGWIDWLTGEEKSEFIYETSKALPYPDWIQKSY